MNAAIIGAIAGGLILILGAIAAHMVSRAIPKHESTGVVMTPTPLPVYYRAIDICRDLHESEVGCMNFFLTSQLVNGEIEAAPVIVGNATSRISIYASRDAMERMLDTTDGLNAYGQRLDLVVGDNWTVTVLLGKEEGHTRAYAIKQVLGGVVLESKEG